MDGSDEKYCRWCRRAKIFARLQQRLDPFVSRAPISATKYYLIAIAGRDQLVGASDHESKPTGAALYHSIHLRLVLLTERLGSPSRMRGLDQATKVVACGLRTAVVPQRRIGDLDPGRQSDLIRTQLSRPT